MVQERFAKRQQDALRPPSGRAGEPIDSEVPGDNNEQGSKLKLLLAWAFVGLPLMWGLLHTLKDAAALFR